MGNQIIAEVSIVPIGTANAGVSKYVAACLEPLKKATDLRYQVSAMGTNIQGPMERVLEVIKQMHQVPFDMGVQRVVTTVKIDDRRDKEETLEGKVERALGKGH